MKDIEKETSTEKSLMKKEQRFKARQSPKK